MNNDGKLVAEKTDVTLSTSRAYLGAAVIKDTAQNNSYIIFAGGEGSTGKSDVIDIYYFSTDGQL